MNDKLTPGRVRMTARRIAREGKERVTVEAIARRLECGTTAIWNVVHRAHGLQSEIEILAEQSGCGRVHIPPDFEWLALPWLAKRLALPPEERRILFKLA